MKATKRIMGCRDTRREIEEAGQDELSLGVDAHLKSCGACETFYDDQLKLRQIVSSIGTVAAPSDFEFRLRARLAGEKRDPKPFTIGNLSFRQATAFATILLLIGSAFLVLSLQSANKDALVADGSKNQVKTTGDQLENSTSGSASVAVNGKASEPSDKSQTTDEDLNPRTTNRRRGVFSGHQLASVNGRPKSRDMGLTAAKVLKPDNLVAAAGHSVFPIDASPEALKVSVDNGRGTPKTISVPGVSFGSQRLATQNPSPLLASSRGAW